MIFVSLRKQKYKSFISQPKIIDLKIFFFKFSNQNNFSKVKSNENVITGVSKITRSQEIILYMKLVISIKSKIIISGASLYNVKSTIRSGVQKPV